MIRPTWSGGNPDVPVGAGFSPAVLVIKASSHSGRHIILTAISAVAANGFFFLVLIDWYVTFSHVPQGTALHGTLPLKPKIAVKT